MKADHIHEGRTYEGRDGTRRIVERRWTHDGSELVAWRADGTGRERSGLCGVGHFAAWARKCILRPGDTVWLGNQLAVVAEPPKDDPFITVQVFGREGER